MRLIWICIIFAAFSVSALEQPQHRYLLFMRTPGKAWNENDPTSFTSGKLQEVARHFPAYDPNNEINIGVGAVFSYFQYDLDMVEQSLRRFLQASESAGIPVYIKLDGEQWWDGRPDLWNWWDPSKPGYNPENAKNVEWTWWSPEYAIKIAWRDWGRQIRVRPPPNLMSSAYRKACHEAMERLVPIIAKWYRNLPERKKELFVGLGVGWESAIGTSSYYYPNGNDLLNKPESDDPHSGPVIDDVLSRGVQQIGYAAVSAAGIRANGDITEDDLVEVIRLHLRDLSKKAVELGIPKEKLYTHTFGNTKGEKLFDAAVNEYANPAWSVYWNAPDIMKDKGIVRNLHRPEVTQWGAREWLLLQPVEKAQPWYSAIKKTINAPGLKMMCIYNWEVVNTSSSEVIGVVNRIIEEGLDPQALPDSEKTASPSLYDVKK